MIRVESVAGDAECEACGQVAMFRIHFGKSSVYLCGACVVETRIAIMPARLAAAAFDAFKQALVSSTESMIEGAKATARLIPLFADISERDREGD